jgi:hypothetical protein
MVCPVNFVKKIIPILILVSLTVSVLTIMSQHVTFALYFLPLNNTLINQEGENVTNRTIPAGPAPAPTNNQTTLALPAGPAPAPTNNQTTLALPPAPTNNQTTLALPPAPTNNQTTLALPPAPTNNLSLLSYIDPTFKFKISYPSNLTKYGVLNLNIHKTTNIGHESLGEVAFGLPKSSGTFLTISFGKEPGNFLLKDYVAAEINFLSRYMGFKQVESIPMSLGGNPAHRIVYVYNIVKNGSEVKQGKSMEIITISNSWPIFVEYRGSLSDYQKYLPLAQKIIDSFQFTK